MGSITFATYLLACLFRIAPVTENARILAIMPMPIYSHQASFRPLWIELSRRGHEVVLLTTHPIGDKNLTNLTEIDFRFNLEMYNKAVESTKKSLTETWLNALQLSFWPASYTLTGSIYQHPEVRKMYQRNSSQTFDVVFAQITVTPGIYALAHKFKAPIIGISPMGLLSINHFLMGASIMPSHPSTWEMETNTGYKLSLWQRMQNFIRQWHHLYYELNEFIVKQQAIAEKYLGKDIPNIADIHRNISIIFSSQEDINSFVRPNAPNLMLIGSLHTSKKPAPLPKELNEFLNDTPNGFIYVSLGSNIQMSSLSEHLLAIFRDVLNSLPCKVLWKSDIILPNIPDHVHMAEWFPQQSVLAHPKIRLFVYQGGLHSTQEALYHGVPLVGIPILIDQESTVSKMVSLGVAKRIGALYISREILNSSIIDVISDIRYKERMVKLKALIRDKFHGNLENAIWWTEFVIRHKGAPHLHNAIAHEPWYERDNMDVIASLTIVVFVILLCALFVIYKLLLTVYNRVAKRRVILNKKRN